MAKAWMGVLLMGAALAGPYGAWGRTETGQTAAMGEKTAGARAETGQTATIAEKTAGTQKLAGYFNLYWDAKQGKLWLEIDKWGSEFLYQSGLSAGMGSNDIGLDRGQLGARGIVRFERSGPKVLLIQENLEDRAGRDGPYHRPAGYKPRGYDPRSSFLGIGYMDYATPISEPIVKRFIARHRLEKKDPKAAMSEPVQPIVYYLDRGAPEPIRSALLEGARWWNQAFEAAGYKNAFRVELMPEGADSMDLRYNVIQWVHRATRGWSYGAAVIDPRTGEIIKGHVTLGSLRVRQDFLIAESLLAPYEKGKPGAAKAQEMALARLRQLAAHEVGHTLGLMHNYSASTVNRSSVMDYPPPYVKLGADGVPDLSEAYAKGIGEWDKVSIAFGYQDFPAGADESASLNKILNDAFARGLRFLTDQNARPAASSSSLAHLWDSGANAVDELNRLMQVRAAALKRF